MDDSIRKIEICRDQLLEAIRTSSICRRYEEKAAALDQDPERRARTDDFRRRSFESQGGLSEGDDIESRHRLFREKQELYADPVIGEYLASELEMCRMLQNLCLSIISVTDLGVDTLFGDMDAGE